MCMHRLPSEVVFDLLATTDMQVNEGTVTVFVHRRNGKVVPGVSMDPRTRLQGILSADGSH